jgi:hypothetical protein
MHPYFAQELVRERQKEMLRAQQFRHPTRSVKASRADRATLSARARRSLGRALVALGTRLLGGNSAGSTSSIELSANRR